MKNNKALTITIICLLSIITILLVAFLVFAIKANFNLKNMNFKVNVSNTLILDEKYNSDLTDVTINANAADIEIHESNDENVRVLLYADKENINNTYVKENNKILNINVEGKECNFFCINITKSKVIVYIPENYNKNINITNNYGDIVVGNLKDANLNIEEDCGNVDINYGRDVTVNNNYGDINIISADKVNIEEDCGDVYVKNVNSAIIENNCGNIKIENIFNYLNIENDCGDIEIVNVKITEDSKIVNNLGNIKITNIKDTYINAETDLGDVEINNNYRSSDITLNIKNDCGDIEIDN